MSDFIFNYPSVDPSTAKRHWHFNIKYVSELTNVSAAEKRRSFPDKQDSVVGARGKKRKWEEDYTPQAIWRLYSILEDGSQLFFPERVESNRENRKQFQSISNHLLV